jgi:hypothetical protein
MPILGIIASSKFGDLGDFESIATVTAGSGGVTDFEFTSIPGTFSHLQLRIIAQSKASGTGIAANLFMRFNSDSTGANYTYHRLSGDGATAAANAGTSMGAAYVGSTLSASGNTSIFTTYIVDILDYANTNKYKTIRSLTGVDKNGAGVVWFGSCLWLSTSAISSIKILEDAGSSGFTQYSQVALYGIRSA